LPAIPRGGAGPPLDPTALAKVFGGACLIQGTQFALAPDMPTYYGDIVPNKCNTKTVRRMGLSILNVGVHIYCFVFKGYDMKVSTTSNALTWMTDAISSLLNNESETTM